MALLDFEFPPELARQISHLEDFDELAKSLLEQAAEVFATKIKDNLSQHKDTGDLIAAIAPQKPKKSKGVWSASVYDSKSPSSKTRNAIKLAELEYGNSHQAATPVVAPSRDAAAAELKNRLMKTMEEALNAWM